MNGYRKTQTQENWLYCSRSKFSWFSWWTSQNLVKVSHAIIVQFMYAKMPPRLNELINQVHLENGVFEQIVTHPENIWSWTVWKLLMSYRWTLWANTPPNWMPTDRNQRAITVKKTWILQKLLSSVEKKTERTSSRQSKQFWKVWHQ